MAGCATTVIVSSIYDVAQPNRITANKDGSKTFEFLFRVADFDQVAAEHRIHDFLQRYAADNGFIGYDVLTTNGFTTKEVPPYVRLTVAVKFKTAS
jgi:hypothetical protein